MTRYLKWLHAVPTVVFIGLGVFAYTKYTAWRAAHDAEDKRFVAATVKSFHETSDLIAGLQTTLKRREKVIQKLQADADAERAKQEKILAAHPVSTAPPVCAPWTTALLSCQLENSKLRHANDSLTADLDSARSVIGVVDTVLDRGTEALKTKTCGFPCIRFRVILGGGLGDDLKFHKGIFAGIQVQ